MKLNAILTAVATICDIAVAAVAITRLDFSDTATLAVYSVLIAVLGAFSGYMLRGTIDAWRADRKRAAERNRARDEFLGLNIKQAMSVSVLAFEDGVMTAAADGDVLGSLWGRDHIVETSQGADGAVQLRLTPMWSKLMNEHRDVFMDVWNRRIFDYNSARGRYVRK